MRSKAIVSVVSVIMCLLLAGTVCYETGVFDKFDLSHIDDSASGVIPVVSLTDTEEESRFTVNFTDADLEKVFGDIGMEFLNYQLIERDRERVEKTGLSDAVSFPFSSQEPNKMYDEVIEEVLRSPIYGDMVARGLGSIRLSTGKTIAELNPWLTEFVGKTDYYYQLSIDQTPCGLEYWLTYRANSLGKVDTSTIYVTEEYRNYAMRLCVLLDRLYVVGIDAFPSAANFVLNNSVYNEFRRTELASYQENWSALILAYTIKKDGNQNYEYMIGFNLTDKRLELISNGYVEPRKPVNPTNPPVVPTNPPVVPTPPPVVPTPVPTERPGTKNPEADPWHQGNAPVGGGENQPTDGPGQPQVTEPPRNPSGPIVAGGEGSGPRTIPAETTGDIPGITPGWTTTTTTDPTTGETHETHEFAKDPPPAEVRNIPTETYHTPEGEAVTVTGTDTVSDGEIAIPD